MRKIIDFASEHPWSVLIGLLVLTMLAATRIDGLRIHISAESMIVEDDPARVLYERTRHFFPEEKVAHSVPARSRSVLAGKLKVSASSQPDRSPALRQFHPEPVLFEEHQKRRREITSEPFLQAFLRTRETRSYPPRPLYPRTPTCSRCLSLWRWQSASMNPEAAHSDKSILVPSRRS